MHCHLLLFNFDYTSLQWSHSQGHGHYDLYQKHSEKLANWRFYSCFRICFEVFIWLFLMQIFNWKLPLKYIYIFFFCEYLSFMPIWKTWEIKTIRRQTVSICVGVARTRILPVLCHFKKIAEPLCQNLIC